MTRTGYHVSPAGTNSGNGSVTQPWDLATALRGGNGRVQAGDTIWVHDGTYTGSFSSTVSGVSGNPVVIRQYPSERAIIDGKGSSSSTLAVRGDWTVIWGLEVTNSDPQRRTSSLSNSWRPNSVVNYASHTRFIEMIVHDGGVGFYSEHNTTDVELIDGIFYNNGWQGPDRGHGHGIYLKSDAGPLVARGNIIFNQFGYGIHAYTNGGSGGLNQIRLIENVAFNNGTLSDNSTSANILLGGEEPVRRGEVDGNLTFFSPGFGGTNAQFGYSRYANDDIAIRGNLFVGGSTVLKIGQWQRAIVESNTLSGRAGLVYLLSRNSGFDWSDTRHMQDPASRAWATDGTSYDWASWRGVTGLGSTDAVSNSLPAASQVFVRRHSHDTRRATVVVYNWSRQSAISIDPSAVLSPGSNFEVRNVQDLHGAPVTRGTWTGGDIHIPLAGATPPAPAGLASSPSPVTGPDFEVFLLIRS
jgi:hypothetical protein